MDLTEKIRSLGYRVEVYVLRVDGVLDLYMPNGKWRNLITKKIGHVTEEHLPLLIRKQIGEAHAARASRKQDDQSGGLRPHWQDSRD